MTLDLVPELCSVKRSSYFSNKIGMYTKNKPRDFVFETLESINKLVDIEDFENIKSFFRRNYFTKTILQKRSTIEKKCLLF